MTHETAPAFPHLTDQERSWGMLAHLAALAGIALLMLEGVFALAGLFMRVPALTGVLFPFIGSVLGPMFIWLARRNHSAFVNDQGLEALNFNISVLLAAIVCWLLTWVFIGFLLGLLLFIYWLVMTIVAGVKAGEGVAYRHAYTLRLVG